MRHKLGYRKLNRTSEHRKALFKNMLNSLIKYEQITTTLPKAKELKPQIDKAITLGKKKTTYIQKKIYLMSYNLKHQFKSCQKLYPKDMKKEKEGTAELLEPVLDTETMLLWQ